MEKFSLIILAKITALFKKRNKMIKESWPSSAIEKPTLMRKITRKKTNSTNTCSSSVTCTDSVLELYED